MSQYCNCTLMVACRHGTLPMSPKKRGSLLLSHREVRRFTNENITCSFPSVFYGPAALLKGKLQFVHSQHMPTQLRKMTRFLITLLFHKGGKKHLQGLLHTALSNFISPSLNAEQSKAVSESSSLITFHFSCSQNEHCNYLSKLSFYVWSVQVLKNYLWFLSVLLMGTSKTE